MLNLQMQGVRPDKYRGNIRVTVQPSGAVQPGVFVSVNDHFQTKESEEPQGADEMLNILHDTWDASIERASRIAERLLELK